MCGTSIDYFEGKKSTLKAMETGKLQKMKLTGFKDVKCEQSTGTSYTVLINPETYTLNYEIKINSEQPAGTNSTSAPFNLSQPQRLEFEFLFDGTGALVSQGVPNPFDVANQQPVDEQIDNFKKTVFDINGDSHQPHFVKLEWGTLHFICKVEKIQFIYKLFKPDGTPLRVVAKTTFVEAVDKPKAEAEKKNNSPDLTHVRTVRAGNTLPLMCFDIYGDSTLYREVARVNNLINFRALTIGQSIFFPPIQN